MVSFDRILSSLKEVTAAKKGKRSSSVSSSSSEEEEEAKLCKASKGKSKTKKSAAVLKDKNVVEQSMPNVRHMGNCACMHACCLLLLNLSMHRVVDESCWFVFLFI